MTIDAVILAAGLGTRLMPLTSYTPKPLIPINQETMVARHISLLKSIGIKRIAINSHSLPKQMHDYFAKQYDDENICLLFEPNLLGTGGGIKRCLIEAKISGYFMLVSTDIYTHVNLHNFLLNLQKLPNRDCGLMLVKHGRTTDAFLNAQDGESDENAVLPLHHSGKLQSSVQFAGIAILPEKWFTDMQATKFSIWQQCLLAHLKTGQLYGTATSEVHIDIGTHEGLADARNQDLRLRRQYNVASGSQATIKSWLL